MKRNKLLNLLSIVAVMALLSGCGLLGGEEPGPEVGVDFWAEPDVVPRGGCAMLRWEVRGEEEYPVFLNGEEVPPFGESEVCLEEPMTFELVVDVPERPIDQRVTIEVEGEGPPEGPPPEGPPPEGGPEVIIFEVHPDVIPPGGCAMLQWEVHPPGEWRVFLLVEGEEVEPVGEREVCPAETWTYGLRVEGPGEPQERFVTLNVEGAGEPAPGEATPPPAPQPGTPAPQPTTPSGPQPTTPPGPQPTTPPSAPTQPPSITYFRANGTAGSITVNAGTSVTLSWEWQRVSEGYLDPGNTPMACPAMPCTYQVTPAATTTYTLRAVNTAGTDTKTVTVNVSSGAPLTFTFSPTSGPAGSDVELHLSRAVQGVTVLYNGRALPKVVLDGGSRLRVTIPGDASSGYFELQWDGQSVKATQQFVVTTASAQGDLILEDVFLSADGQQLILRVGTNPPGSLTGSFQYQIVATATSAVLKTGSFTIPTGSQAFWTGWKPNSGVGIKITIDPNGNIPETNENNNAMTKTF